MTNGHYSLNRSKLPAFIPGKSLSSPCPSQLDTHGCPVLPLLGTHKPGTFLHSHSPAGLGNAEQAELRGRFQPSRATGATPGSPHAQKEIYFFFFSNDSPLTFQTPVQPKAAKNSPQALHLIFILQQSSLFPAAFLPFLAAPWMLDLSWGHA